MRTSVSAHAPTSLAVKGRHPMLPRLTRFALLAVVGGLLAWSLAGTATAQVIPAQQAAMLAAHNTLRRTVADAETRRLGRTVTIPDMTWNAEVAAIAQAWANNLLATGTFEHNPNLGNLGENLFMESGGNPATSGDRAFQGWASEAASYTWDTNACTDVCGHYTQLVWAGSTSIGCGVATNGRDTYWVCDYAPPGNFRGQRPYEPGGAAAPLPPGQPPANQPPANQPPANQPPANQPPVTGPTATAASWAGTWTVDDFGFGGGGTLKLTQTGNQVTGTYTYDDPSGCGAQDGTVTGTIAGTALSVTFEETGCAGTGGGAAFLTLAADGGSFSGTWNGTRTGR